MEVGRSTGYVKGQGESCLHLMKHVSFIKKRTKWLVLWPTNWVLELFTYYDVRRDNHTPYIHDDMKEHYLEHGQYIPIPLWLALPSLGIMALTIGLLDECFSQTHQSLQWLITYSSLLKSK